MEVDFNAHARLLYINIKDDSIDKLIENQKVSFNKDNLKVEVYAFNKERKIIFYSTPLYGYEGFVNSELDQDGYGRHISYTSDSKIITHGLFTSGNKEGNCIFAMMGKNSIYNTVDLINNHYNHSKSNNGFSNICITNYHHENKIGPYLLFSIPDNENIVKDIQCSLQNKENLNNHNLSIKGKDISFKVFYGEDIKNSVEKLKSGYVFIYSSSSCSLYKGKLKDESYDDKEAFFCNIENDTVYYGEFKDGKFIKGNIILNFSDKERIKIYEYSEENKITITLLSNKDDVILEKHQRLISYTNGKERFSFNKEKYFTIQEYFYFILLKSFTVLNDKLDVEYFRNKSNVDKVHRIHELIVQLKNIIEV